MYTMKAYAKRHAFKHRTFLILCGSSEFVVACAIAMHVYNDVVNCSLPSWPSSVVQ